MQVYACPRKAHRVGKAKRYCFLERSYFAFTRTHPRLSGLLAAHILSKTSLENLTQPQHWENSLCSFVMRISSHKRMAASRGIASPLSSLPDDIELARVDDSVLSKNTLRR